MKGLRKSRMLKAVAAVLLFVSIVSIPLSVVGEIYLADQVFDGNWEEMHSGEFRDSKRFSDLFSRRIGQLAEYVKLKRILQTDGELDYNKQVCHVLEEGYDHLMPQGYTIGELIKNNSFFVEDIDSQNTTLLEELFSLYPQQQWYVYTDEKGEAALGYVETAEFIKDFNLDTDWFLAEDYSQAIELWEEYTAASDVAETESREESNAKSVFYITDVESVSVSVQEPGTQETVKLPEGACWVFTMEELAYRYTYYVAYYQHYQTLFEKEANHRFVYSLKIEDQEYSNADNLQEYRSGESVSEGSLYYSSEAYTVDTNVSNVQRIYVDNLEKAVQGKPFEFFAAVVPLEKVDGTEGDAFTIKENYVNRLQNMSNLLLMFGIGGVVGVLITGLYLIASAGHAKDVEGVRLTWFDRWYTEPAAACSVIGVTSLCVLLGEALAELFRYEDFGALAAVCAAALGSYLTMLFSLASLLRRIKAGTLWENSLLRNGGKWLLRAVRRISHGCYVIYEERDITVRMIVLYVVVLAASVITGGFAMIAFISGSGWILFFMLLFTAIHAGTLYLLLRERMEYKRITEGVERISNGDLNYKVDEAGMQKDNKRLAVAVNRVSDGFAEAVEKSIKDERMKTDLITNVSHDIKTPLTSIINYVDLLKREQIEDEKIQSYIEVLDNKSQRLKNLTDDLVEASKLSSGTVVLTMQEINLVELVHQANGEFTEKFAKKNLTIISTIPDDPIIVDADGRRIWRVLENLYNNVAKYAMENTRVYVSVLPEEGKVSFVMKNISANPLNISADELTERFIRGDVSRSTEGSGLGLSIAQSLTELMGGSFEIYLDGDLFRATVTFPVKAR